MVWPYASMAYMGHLDDQTLQIKIALEDAQRFSCKEFLEEYSVCLQI